MELTLEEALDVLLEIISGSVVVAMMFVYMNAQSIITILERIM